MGAVCYRNTVIIAASPKSFADIQGHIAAAINDRSSSPELTTTPEGDWRTGNSELVSIASFLPECQMRQALDRQKDFRQFTAALAFVDISGYSSLASTMGPRGAGVLSQCINSYLRQLIEVISHYGGDIVKFAGDALVCIWEDGEGRSEVASLLAAINCCLKLQRTHGNYGVPDSTVVLKIHIGITYGSFFTIFLGPEEQRYFLLCGHPLTNINQVVSAARPGEVCVTQQSWSMVSFRCVGYHRTGTDACVVESLTTQSEDMEVGSPLLGPHRRRLTQEDRFVLLNHVPPMVEAQLQTLHSSVNAMAMLRDMTVIFIGLPELQYNNVYGIQQFFEGVAQGVAEQNGTVIQMLHDDKDMHVVAAFGLTGTLDVISAVRGALACKRNLERSFARICMGIATGQVFSGVFGSAIRCSFDILGDTVNTSCRLMEYAYKSKFGMLCDDETRSACSSTFTFRPVPNLHAKGRTKPVKVYSVEDDGMLDTLGLHNLREQLSKQSRAIGRHRDKMIIDSAVQLLLNNTITKPARSAMTRRSAHLARGSDAHYFTESIHIRSAPQSDHVPMLVFQGQFGMGKSSLSHYLCSNWSLLPVLDVRIRENQGKRRLGTFSEVFQQLFTWLALTGNMERKFGCDTTEEVVQCTMGSSFSSKLSLLNPVLLTDFPVEKEDSPHASFVQHVDDLPEMLLRLMQNISHRIGAIIICYDDAQFMDPTSWNLMCMLHDWAWEEGAPLLQVLFIETQSEANGRVPLVGTTNVQLSNYSVADIRECLELSFHDRLADHSTVSQSLCDLVAQKSTCHPLLLSELVEFIQTKLPFFLTPQGELTLDADGMAAVEEFDFGLSKRVGMLVLQQFDQLSPTQQLILKLSAVIALEPVPVYVPLLKSLLSSLPAPRIDVDLAQLVSKGILTDGGALALAPIVTSWRAWDSYRFTIQCYAAALASMMSPNYFAFTNRQIAKVLASSGLVCETRNYACWGRYLIKGNCQEQGIDILLKALEMAARAGQQQEAASILATLHRLELTPGQIAVRKALQKQCRLPGPQSSSEHATKKTDLVNVQEVLSLQSSSTGIPDTDGAARRIFLTLGKVIHSTKARKKLDESELQRLFVQLSSLQLLEEYILTQPGIPEEDRQAVISQLEALLSLQKISPGQKVELTLSHLEQIRMAFEANILSMKKAANGILRKIKDIEPAWRPEYATHIQLLDEHHRQLFKTASEFFFLARSSTESHAEIMKKSGRLLKRLLQFVLYHFQAEENLMNRTGYPEVRQHMYFHQEYVRRCLVFEQQYAEGAFQVDESVLETLHYWLIVHVGHSDRHFGDWINGRFGHTMTNDDLLQLMGAHGSEP